MSQNFNKKMVMTATAFALVVLLSRVFTGLSQVANNAVIYNGVITLLLVAMGLLVTFLFGRDIQKHLQTTAKEESADNV